MTRHSIFLSAVLLLSIGCNPDSPTQPRTSDSGKLPALATSASPITLTFMCGKTFRLRNPADTALVVTYDVYKTSERATLTLRPRSAGSPYSETFIVTQNKGTVRVFSNSVLVQTKANGGFACTGQRKLRVVQYQGVTGGPLTPSASHPAGAAVTYGFSALPGYHNLSVVLDGRLVPASGTIKMDNDHVLLVGADLRAQLQPGDEALVQSAKAIITSADPVAAYQAHLDRVGELFDQVGEAEASRRLAAVNFLAFDPLLDAAAIRSTSRRLANHEFLVQRGSSAVALRGSRALSLSSIESGELEPTTIRYVNGILSNQGRVAEAARRLGLITREVGLDNPNVSVTQFYNQTFSDPVETLAQRQARCLQDGVEGSKFLNEISRFIRWVRCADEGITYLIGSFDLVEVSRQFLSVVSDRPLGADADATALGELVQTDRAAGRHVILVPHSQGNLITQLALLQPPPGSLDPSLGVCFAAVPLAAPTAGNWQLPSSRLAPVQVAHDIILTTPSSHFTAIDTDSSIKAANEIAVALASANADGDNGGVAGLTIAWGVKLHMLLDSYFPAPQSRQAIGDGLMAMYRDCAAESVSVTPTAGTLAPGESLQLTATAYNQVGNPLPGRKILWSSSHPAVATVDSAGLVRALVEGTTVISARAGPRTGNVVLNVGGPSPFPGKNVYGSWHGTVADPQGGGTCPARLSMVNIDASMTLTCPGREPVTYRWPIREFPPHHVRVILRQTAFQRMELALTGDGDTLEGTWWFMPIFWPDGVAVSFRRGILPQ